MYCKTIYENHKVIYKLQDNGGCCHGNLSTNKYRYISLTMYIYIKNNGITCKICGCTFPVIIRSMKLKILDVNALLHYVSVKLSTPELILTGARGNN